MEEALLWCVCMSVRGFFQLQSQLAGQGFVLMQDNDSKHISKLCQRYIRSKEEQHVLQLMSWLVQLADLNPIELAWEELDRWVKAKQSTNVAHLWQLLQENRAELSSVYSQSLVERMLRTCESVIVAKGGNILMNQNFKEVFCVNLHLMRLRKAFIQYNK